MKRSGQSTIEYILLLAAIIIVCIFFLRKGGPMNSAVDNVLNGSFNMINMLATETNIIP